MKKKALFRWYRAVHVWVHEELQDVLVFPTRECGEHCMQRACIHTTCSECNILELVILLRGWNFASGSMAVASCIVTSCFLTKRNSITTVSIIHTTLMCGQMRIPMPLWKATFNYVLVSLCGVQFWMISWLALSSWKVVLQERRTSDFCRRNCPDFWRMCLWVNEVVCYFQHEGAPPHFSREVRNFLNCRFPERWIRCGSLHNWPARSPDLSPLDYCVWGWMKELVYSVKVGTRSALLGRILDAADRIRNSQQKLQWATRTVHNRAAACVAAGSGIFENQL